MRSTESISRLTIPTLSLSLSLSLSEGSSFLGMDSSPKLPSLHSGNLHIYIPLFFSYTQCNLPFIQSITKRSHQGTRQHNNNNNNNNNSSSSSSSNKNLFSLLGSIQFSRLLFIKTNRTTSCSSLATVMYCSIRMSK